MIINYIYILKRNEEANMDLKKILLTKVAKVSEYTAEQGDGWPTYWGFHEIIPDSDIKTILAKKKNEKKNGKTGRSFHDSSHGSVTDCMWR